jgi:hypothetical protein
MQLKDVGNGAKLEVNERQERVLSGSIGWVVPW